MIIIPAIDLLDGKVVRLYKGDMDNVTVYSKEPVDMAKKFIDMGATRLHIVDLDGAREGTSVNFKTIEQIAKLDGLKIEAGGGIRDLSRASSYADAGVYYFILGTLAVKNPGETLNIIRKFPGRAILGVDARKGKVATEGWYEDSELKAAELVKSYGAEAVESVIYTDINKDGTLSGLNMQELLDMADASPFGVIASGGVASSADIDALYEAAHPNLKGCIVGKAYYEGKIDLEYELKKRGVPNH